MSEKIDITANDVLEILEATYKQAPLHFSEQKGKYYIGLKELESLLKVDFKRIPIETRKNVIVCFAEGQVEQRLLDEKIREFLS